MPTLPRRLTITGVWLIAASTGFAAPAGALGDGPATWEPPTVQLESIQRPDPPAFPVAFDLFKPAFGPLDTVACLVRTGPFTGNGIVRRSGDSSPTLDWFEPDVPSDILEAVIAPNGTVLFARGFAAQPGSIDALAPGAREPVTIVPGGGPLDSDLFFGIVPAANGALAFISAGLPAADRRDWAWWTPGAQPIAFASTLHSSVEGLGSIAVDADGSIVGSVESSASTTFENDEIRRYTAPDTFDVIAVSQSQDPTSPAIHFTNTIVGGPRLLVEGVNEDLSRTVYEVGTDEPGGLTAVVGPVLFLLGQDDAGRVVYLTLDDTSGVELMVLDGDQTTRIMGHGDTVETSRGPGTLLFDSVIRPAVAPDGRVGAVGCVDLPEEPQFCDCLVFVASRPIPGPDADVNGDGDVDFLDLLSILSLWGTDDVAADLDGNGIVDFGDVLQVLAALA